MKRILLIIVTVAIVLSLSSCTDVNIKSDDNIKFEFRNNHFSDSIEQVQKNEGEEGEIREREYCTYLYYDLEVHKPYISTESYVFINNGLHHISEDFNYYGMEKIEDVYNKVKDSLMKYGNPDKESKEDKMYKAFWGKNEYSIVLLVTDIGVIVIYIPDSVKAKKYYDSYQLSDLFDEMEISAS